MMDSISDLKKGVRLFIISWNRFGKPQRAQRTQRKQQRSVPSVPSVVNLLRHNPTHPEEIKKPQESHQRYYHPSETPKPSIRQEAIT
jgi:hypothetical protein